MKTYNKRQLTEQEAYDRLSALCASSEHCTAEMENKMGEWGIDSEVQERIIIRLNNEHFIDDTRYARAFVRDKYRYNKWGRNRLCQELKLKHIPATVINEAMEEIDEDQYMTILTNELQKKKASIKASNDYELRCKLYRFAISRGYATDEIERAIGSQDEW